MEDLWANLMKKGVSKRWRQAVIQMGTGWSKTSDNTGKTAGSHVREQLTKMNFKQRREEIRHLAEYSRASSKPLTIERWNFFSQAGYKHNTIADWGWLTQAGQSHGKRVTEKLSDIMRWRKSYDRYKGKRRMDTWKRLRKLMRKWELRDRIWVMQNTWWMILMPCLVWIRFTYMIIFNLCWVM